MPNHLVTAWLGRSLDFLFPPRCAGCRRRGEWLCADCRASLVAPEPPLCHRCRASVTRPGPCVICRHHPPAFDSLLAAYQYTGALRPAIHRFKYGGERALGNCLARLLVEAITLPTSVDLVLPVPLHPDRLRQRGYNQSNILARALAERLDRPLAANLLRVRSTRPQVGLDAAGRRDNVRGAFAWHGPPITSRHALLVDDVCTTGSTLSACAAAVRAAGARRVTAVVLARD